MNREPVIAYIDSPGLPQFDDGAGPEAHLAFTVSDIAEAITVYGPSAILNDLFYRYPEVYSTLMIHFYQDFYKLSESDKFQPREHS